MFELPRCEGGNRKVTFRASIQTAYRGHKIKENPNGFLERIETIPTDKEHLSQDEVIRLVLIIFRKQYYPDSHLVPQCKQEQILHFSYSLDGWHNLSVPPFEVHIITIDVSVTISHLGIHPAFHHLTTPDIVGKRSQQQGITTKATEHGA